MDQMKSLQKGASYPAVTDGDVRSQLLSMPSHTEQQIISNKLERLWDETQNLKTIYQRKRVALEELKKSFLHQAFSGNL
jgi:type I restriction enzyme S subunit